MERMSMYWCLSLSKVRLLTSNFTFTHGCIGGWKRTICFCAAVQPSYHNSGSWVSSDPHILWIGMLLKLTVLLWVNEGYILYFCYCFRLVRWFRLNLSIQRGRSISTDWWAFPIRFHNFIYCHPVLLWLLPSILAVSCNIVLF